MSRLTSKLVSSAINLMLVAVMAACGAPKIDKKSEVGQPYVPHPPLEPIATAKDPTVVTLDNPSKKPTAASKDKLAQLSQFSAFCTSTDNSEIRLTIEAILTELETKDCAQAVEKLAKLTSFSLSARIKVGTTFEIKNPIKDLRPIGSISHLKSLTLDYQSFDNIDALSGLSNLATLKIRYNTQLKNIAGLTALKNLTSLDITNSSDAKSPGQLSDISSLAQLNQLESLTIQYNPLTDISSLGALKALTTLNLNGMQVSQLQPLGSLSKLQQLELDNIKELSDLSPLTNLSELTTLSVRLGNISNIAPLSSLKKLAFLDLNGNSISDLSPLAEMSELTEVNFSKNKISTLPDLSKLTKLTKLDLSRNVLGDLSSLANSVSLTSLKLNNNSIIELVPLSGLLKLETLNLSYNTGIADINALSGMSNLLDYGSSKGLYLKSAGIESLRNDANCPLKCESKAVTDFCNQRI